MYFDITNFGIMEKNNVIFQKIKKIVSKNELLLLLIILLTVFLNWLAISGLNMLIIIIILTIAGFYFLTAFFNEKGVSVHQKFLIQLSGLASAMVLVGVLFSMLNWPSLIQNLVIGGVGLIGVLVGGSVLGLVSTKYLPRNMVIRIVTLIILAAYFLMNDLLV